MENKDENEEIAENKENDQNFENNEKKLREKVNETNETKKENELNEEIAEIKEINQNFENNEEKLSEKVNEGEETEKENELQNNNKNKDGNEIKEEENELKEENGKVGINQQNENIILEKENKYLSEENHNEKSESNNKEEKISEIYQMERIYDIETNHDYIFRICIVGDCGVGKTSLLTRFCDNSFQESYNNTIGVDFRFVTLKYQNLVIKLHIWDTAVQERFKSIALNYFKSSHGFMFVYDISSKKTFENIPNWINLAFSNSNNIGINFLVGNKTDIEERAVEIDEGEKFAKDKKLFFFEASAKNNDNVEKIFKYFAFKLSEYFLKKKEEYIKNNEKTKISNNIEEINPNNSGKSECFC